MKKYALLLKLALTTFLLGLLSVFVWVSLWKPLGTSSPINQREQSFSISPRPETEPENYEILELSFCEVVKKPEAYNGKIIKLNGIFEMTQHGPLFDGECPRPEETLTWVKVTPEQWKEIRALTLKANKNKTWWGDLDMQAVGKFEKNTLPPPNEDGLVLSSDSHEHQAPYRFELIKIERAAARPPQKFEMPAPPPILRRKSLEPRKK